MKKSFIAITVFTALAVTISSCKTKDKTGLLIPKDAAVVVHFNAASFSSKLSWEDIKTTNWFQRAESKNHDSLLSNLMKDPASSGMDLKSDFVYFIKIRAGGAYFVVDGKLKDDAAFAAYCKQLIPDGSQSQDGAFSSISKNDKGAILWNKEHFVYVINTPGMPWNNRGDENSFSEPGKPITADSLKKYGKEVLSLSNTETLGTDEHFAALINEPGDIHFWMDMGKMYSQNNMTGQVMSMMKVGSYFDGNKVAVTLNFENGKISMKGKQYYGKEMTSILKKYPPKPLDAALINRLPSENVMAAFAVNFQPEALDETLKTFGLDGIINMLLGRAHLTLDDIIKANKGQMLFALTGIGSKEVTDTLNSGENEKATTFTHKERSAKFLFANSINNKGAFDRLLDFLKGSTGKFGQSSKDYNFQVKDDWFVAGDSVNVTRFLSGNSNSVPFADRISGHPAGGYIDFQKIISHLAEKNPDSSRAAILNASKNLWQDMVMTGGDFTNGAITFSMEVNLVNKNINSLKQLNSYFDQVATAYKDHFAFNKEKMDSLNKEKEK